MGGLKCAMMSSAERSRGRHKVCKRLGGAAGAVVVVAECMGRAAICRQHKCLESRVSWETSILEWDAVVSRSKERR